MKKIPRVGQWVRVRFDDVGAQDGIYIGDDVFLQPGEDDSTSFNGAPVVKLGKAFDAKDTGLD